MPADINAAAGYETWKKYEYISTVNSHIAVLRALPVEPRSNQSAAERHTARDSPKWCAVKLIPVAARRHTTASKRYDDIWTTCIDDKVRVIRCFSGAKFSC
jgi:hypothetical protein